MKKIDSQPHTSISDNIWLSRQELVQIIGDLHLPRRANLDTASAQSSSKS